MHEEEWSQTGGFHPGSPGCSGSATVVPRKRHVGEWCWQGPELSTPNAEPRRAETSRLALPLVGDRDAAHEDAACVSRKIIQGAGYALAALLDHMRVNHGGGNVGMTKEFLDGTDVRAPLQEVCRKTVPLMPGSA